MPSHPLHHARLRASATAVVAALVTLAAVSPAGAIARGREPGTPVPSATTVPASPEYFADVRGDPLDYANAEDQLLIPAAHQNTTPRLEDGQLRWTRTQTMDIALLWPGYAPQALAVGREGFAQPIDASVYTHVAFRLYSPTRTAGRVLFEKCARVGADACENGSPTFFVEPGWHTYTVRMDEVTGTETWSGPVVGLRLSVAGDGTPQEMALDWFRVFRPAQPVVLTGATGPLYWDTDTDRANNTPESPDWGPVEGTVFPADAHPAGAYHFYSDAGDHSAPVSVDGPLPVILDPDLAGGADYAETVRGDAWDFDQAGDAAGVGGIDSVELRDGVLHGRNTEGPGNPFVELPLAGTVDAERFHRLTVTTALDGPFDLSFALGGGSHGRLLWSQVGQPGNVFRYDSKDLVVYPGVGTYTVDLHTAPRGAVIDEASTPGPGWTGQIDALRYDPNEDPGPRSWSLDEIALRADDEASGGAFDIRWRDASAGETAGTTVSIYRDTDDEGFDGVPIVEGLTQREGENTYRWETEDVPPGRYHLYVVATRGAGTGRRYATGPVVVGEGGAARGGPDRPPADPPPAEVPPADPPPSDPEDDAPPAAEPGKGTAVRLAGADRLSTAVAISRAAHPDGADAAIVAAAGNFPDALAAAPLAAAVGGPVLLNPADGLAPAVAAELERLGAHRVVVMGGVQAQSAAVVDAVAALPGVTVERVAGPDRSATAAAAAERAVQEWGAAGIDGAGEEVLVASGGDFPDALAAGPLAAAAHRPLLLVGEDDVPPATAAALEALGTQRVTVVGGTAVVGPEVAEALARDHEVDRLAGESRFATAAAVAAAATAAGADPDVVLVASGGTFPDALAAGPAAGAGGGVLLLTGGDELAGAVRDHVRERGPRLEWLAVAGGTSVISEAVVAELEAAAEGS